MEQFIEFETQEQLIRKEEIAYQDIRKSRVNTAFCIIVCRCNNLPVEAMGIEWLHLCL